MEYQDELDDSSDGRQSPEHEDGYGPRGLVNETMIFNLEIDCKPVSQSST
jgi:hypothetical protein